MDSQSASRDSRQRFRLCKRPSVDFRSRILAITIPKIEALRKVSALVGHWLNLSEPLMTDLLITTPTVANPSPATARCSDPSSVRNGLLCALLMAVCVLTIYPVGNVPCADDFSYMKSALDFEQTGKVLYNGWATAMLGWLIPWGALFIKVFGFSFTILRLSMLPIAAATIYLLHQILRRFGINPQNAAFGALAVGLSPIFL